MRIPPLPGPVGVLDADRMAARAVGRPAEILRPVVIADYDPAWPERYAVRERRIREVLGERALAVEHVGSTAVPGLAAKDRLDIDLIVADPADEDGYVPALETVGYALRSRDVDWYQHRGLWETDHAVTLHVFGPDCDEHLRHLVFRDWLRGHPDDRERYAAAKRRAAAEHGRSVYAYNGAKAAVVLDILRRAGLRPAGER